MGTKLKNDVLFGEDIGEMLDIFYQLEPDVRTSYALAMRHTVAAAAAAAAAAASAAKSKLGSNVVELFGK